MKILITLNLFLGVSHLSSNAATVVLPFPLDPTIATVLPAGIFRLKFFKTGLSGRVGYSKVTSSKVILPLKDLSVIISPPFISGEAGRSRN